MSDIAVTGQGSIFDQIAEKWLAPLRRLYPVQTSYTVRSDRVYSPGGSQANDPRGSQTGFWNIFPNESLNMGGSVVGGSNYNVSSGVSTPFVVGVAVATVLIVLYILKR